MEIPWRSIKRFFLRKLLKSSLLLALSKMGAAREMHYNAAGRVIFRKSLTKLFSAICKGVLECKQKLPRCVSVPLRYAGETACACILGGVEKPPEKNKCQTQTKNKGGKEGGRREWGSSPNPTQTNKSHPSQNACTTHFAQHIWGALKRIWGASACILAHPAKS